VSLKDEKKENLFNSKLDLNLWNELAKCYLWSAATFGSVTWTLPEIGLTTPERFRNFVLEKG
jgi:hypothetical protein